MDARYIDWLLRRLFYCLVLWPVALVVLGLNLRHRERLPVKGPAIIAANHNSHLDTLVLLSLFPFKAIDRVRPVAAADYFLRNRFLAWFSTRVLNILPLEREAAGRGDDVLWDCVDALKRGEILIVFPEGSRGDPEVMARFKGGVARLKERVSAAPVIPVFLHGLGKALPKGEVILVPFFVDIFIGQEVAWTGNRAAFTTALEESVRQLAAEFAAPAPPH
jgi:1-acyl-sn-glycerol-3-phosphate acyltransferase